MKNSDIVGMKTEVRVLDLLHGMGYTARRTGYNSPWDKQGVDIVIEVDDRIVLLQVKTSWVDDHERYKKWNIRVIHNVKRKSDAQICADLRKILE